MPNSHKCIGVNGKALQIHTVEKKKKHIVYYKSRENPYQVLEVMQCISGTSTTSHMICIRYYKSHDLYQVLQVMHAMPECAMCLVWSNHYHYSTKKVSFVCCRLYCYLYFALVTIQTVTNEWFFQYSFVLWWYLYNTSKLAAAHEGITSIKMHIVNLAIPE